MSRRMQQFSKSTALLRSLIHYSLCLYSSGTLSSGTSCVRTGPVSGPGASSTPFTISASNAFPSSSNSATLSESASSILDNPCNSPDSSPARRSLPNSSGANATVSSPPLFSRTSSKTKASLSRLIPFLPPDRVFIDAVFGGVFLFANFFLGFNIFLADFFFLIAFFIGVTLHSSQSSSPSPNFVLGFLSWEQYAQSTTCWSFLSQTDK